MEEKGLDRKILLHQGEHIYVYDLENSGTLGMVDRWLDHYLKDEDNGVETEPKVLVESNIDQSRWFTSDTWPPEGWAYEEFPVDADSDRLTIKDDLSATVYDKAEDNQKEWLDELILNGSEDYINRIKFVWDPFDTDATAETLRIAGEVKVSFDAAIDKKTAILSAMLVDLGEDRRITAEQIEVEGKDDGTFRFGLEKEPSQYKVISRCWLNAQNRTCLWSKEDIEPGEFYHYDMKMVPTDHTLKRGHKLALILYGIDAQQTQRPGTVTEITFIADSIDVRVPVIR